MMKKLLIFAIVMLFACPLYAQWATNYAYGSGAAKSALAGDDDPESPIGMYVGAGSVDLKNFDVQTGLVYRLTNRLSLSGQVNGTYNEAADRGDFGLGIVGFYFVGQARDLYLRGGWIPKVAEGEKTNTEVTKAGIGYMGRDGTLPFAKISVGFPYILDIGKDLSTGAWEVHGAMYFEF